MWVVEAVLSDTGVIVDISWKATVTEFAKPMEHGDQSLQFVSEVIVYDYMRPPANYVILAQ